MNYSTTSFEASLVQPSLSLLLFVPRSQQEKPLTEPNEASLVEVVAVLLLLLLLLIMMMTTILP